MSDLPPAPVQVPQQANGRLPVSTILGATRLTVIVKTKNGSENSGYGSTESLQDERSEIENPMKRDSVNLMPLSSAEWYNTTYDVLYEWTADDGIDSESRKIHQERGTQSPARHRSREAKDMDGSYKASRTPGC